MVTATLLVGLAIAFRLLSPALHIWNFVPIGAVALYAGSRLPRRWAWAVPLVAMILSDIILDYGQHRPVFELSRWTIYATLAATPLLGRFANRRGFGLWEVPFLSILASVVFFLTSNLATWAEGRLYPMTWAGLVSCYYMAIPFYKMTFAAEMLGACVLFGLGPVVEKAAARIWPRGLGATSKVADVRELS
jgi:hypothetical protein